MYIQFLFLFSLVNLFHESDPCHCFISIPIILTSFFSKQTDQSLFNHFTSVRYELFLIFTGLNNAVINIFV